jgi:putative ABC transport system substrate-binding protein
LTTRRKLLQALAASLAALPLAGGSQSVARPRHIGYLSTGSFGTNGVFLQALKDALKAQGYVDGKDIVIDVLWAGDNAGAFPELAVSLVKTRPDAIIGTCIPSTRAAKNATTSIPVVMSVDGDPVASGLVMSLARPGGNVTGTSTLFEELVPKWLEFLSDAAPKARDIAILTNPDDVADPYFWAKFEAAAQRIGVKAIKVEANTPAGIDRSFGEMKTRGAGALVVMTEAFFVSQIPRLVAHAERNRMPAIYGYREFTQAGGLMSYGLSYREYYKRVAVYVAAVLKGVKPADLPVEQPTKIELVINRATARKLGLDIPQSLTLRADEVIQ